MTIDHLRVDHEITVLQSFTDEAGTSMQVGDSGVVRSMSFDAVRAVITIDLERGAQIVRLVFGLRATSGPRNGHMREYFALGADVSSPRVVPSTSPVRELSQTMIVPPAKAKAESQAKADGASSWWQDARSTEGPDRLEAVENQMRAEIQHIGVAASIAELYAQRMRAFQEAGNEPRAIAAFKLAVEWMATYAGWATSGGEGAANSLERDRFTEALVKEFGYDPTLDAS